MLRKCSPFRIYPDDWERWEDCVWVWAARPKSDMLVLFCTRPWGKVRFDQVTIRTPRDSLTWIDGEQALMGKYIKQALERAGSQSNPLQLSDAVFRKAYPALCEFMTDSDDGEGGKRKLSRITVFFESGFFKAFLNDPDSQRSLCVSSATFEGLWRALEGAITSDAPPWRDLPDWDQKKKKRT